MNTITLWIARRLRIANGSGSNAGSAIAVAGIALAVIVMEFTIAIVIGFKNSIEDKLAGFDAQVAIEAPLNEYGSSTGFITYSDTLENIIQTTLPNADVRLSLRQPGIMKTDSDFEALIFIGQSNYGTFEHQNITAGFMPDFSADSTANMIVISEPTAKALNLAVGDKITATFIVDGTIKLRRPVIAGIYRSNFDNYDRSIAYAPLSMLQRVIGINANEGSRIDIRGVENIDEATYQLRCALIDGFTSETLPAFYPVTNIQSSGAMYYNWLALLDTNVIVIFILMTAVAGLTLISSLFILILERVSTIGILRSIGSTKKQIRQIFIDMCLRLVGRGMLIGNIIAIPLLIIQKATHILPLDPQMYFLDSVPVQINFLSLIILNIGIAFVAWLILVLPSNLAAKIDPAKAMTFE